MWKVLKTKENYSKALARAMKIFHAEEGTAESDELDLLLVLIKNYEDNHIQLPKLDLIEMIKLKLEEKGLKMKDPEPVIGSKGHVSSVLNVKRELTLKMAKKLHDFLEIPAEVFMV